MSESVETYVGPLSYVEQTLTKDSAANLHRRIDLQRASQLVMWAFPMVQFTEAIRANYDNLGADRSETPVGLYVGYDGVYPFFTPNLVVPYTIGSIDLAATGPVILKIPAGGVYGVANDRWQQPVVEFNSGLAETFLFLPPGEAAPEGVEGTVVRPNTFEVLWFFRVVATGPEAEDLSSQVEVYPLGTADDPPPPAQIVEFRPEPGVDYVTNTPPSDMGFWEIVHGYVQKEQMADRDRFFYAWLAGLGIEKGKPFDPSPDQQIILREGLQVGLAMAQANSFNKRAEGAEYADSGWHQLLAGLDPAIDLDQYSLFDQRAAYTYEATTTSAGMISRVAGQGSAYVGAYYDASGDVLDGGQRYRLRVAPDVPAANFWCVTGYEAATRLLLRNDVHQVEVDSRNPDVEVNADGTVDLYFGPSAPAGLEANWIQTNPGQSWFAYFRLYGPMDPYFDETWPMNPIERT